MPEPRPAREPVPGRFRRALAWASRHAAWFVALSAAGQVLALVLALRGHGLIDLRVFRSLPPALRTGRLYEARLVLPGREMFPLPFSYPPFAALLFLPLSWMPWVAVAAAWDAASVACLAWLVHQSLLLTGRQESMRRTALWTAVLVWIEPVASTLSFGQVNLFLAALTLWGVTRRRPALTGLAVGVAAGIKLVPGIALLYLLLTRRWAAAAWSAAVGAATAGLGWLVAPGASERFWFHLLGDAGRDGPVGSVINQSLRGALSRTVGHDVGMTAPWWIAAALVVLLACGALRTSLRRGDHLAVLIVVELLGLLLAPLAWDHHWVWVVPVVIWSATRRSMTGRLPALLWSAVTLCRPVGLLLTMQPDIWTFGRPWYLAALGWVYPVCAVVTLVCIAASPDTAPRVTACRTRMRVTSITSPDGLAVTPGFHDAPSSTADGCSADG